jgi:hypothetical protein
MKEPITPNMPMGVLLGALVAAALVAWQSDQDSMIGRFRIFVFSVVLLAVCFCVGAFVTALVHSWVR